MNDITKIKVAISFILEMKNLQNVLAATQARKAVSSPTGTRTIPQSLTM